MSIQHLFTPNNYNLNCGTINPLNQTVVIDCAIPGGQPANFITVNGTNLNFLTITIQKIGGMATLSFPAYEFTAVSGGYDFFFVGLPVEYTPKFDEMAWVVRADVNGSFTYLILSIYNDQRFEITYNDESSDFQINDNVYVYASSVTYPLA